MRLFRVMCSDGPLTGVLILVLIFCVDTPVYSPCQPVISQGAFVSSRAGLGYYSGVHPRIAMCHSPSQSRASCSSRLAYILPGPSCKVGVIEAGEV